MQSTACVFRHPHGQATARDARYESELPRRAAAVSDAAIVIARAPRLEWCARVRGIDPLRAIDVSGIDAFRRAGLYAFAAPSRYLRLFVFDPDADSAGCYRYEAWLLSGRGAPYSLHRPLVSSGRALSGDAVDAMAACERDCAEALHALGGELLL